MSDRADQRRRGIEMLAAELAHGDEPISADDLAFLRELGRSWESERDPIPWSQLEARVG